MTIQPMTQRGGEPVMTLAALVDDEVAFRDWYDRVLPRVYGFLFVRCNHDVALAEELTQQTFVEAIRRRSQFDGRSDVVTWLCAIGRNKLMDHYRRAGREHRRHLRLVAGWNGATGGGLDASDDRSAILAALDQLSADQRMVLLMRHLDGMSIRQIASRIGRSESAADSFLFRARDAFRRAYRGASDER